jgi:hypothetical protein
MSFSRHGPLKQNTTTTTLQCTATEHAVAMRATLENYHRAFIRCCMFEQWKLLQSICIGCLCISILIVASWSAVLQNSILDLTILISVWGAHATNIIRLRMGSIYFVEQSGAVDQCNIISMIMWSLLSLFSNRVGFEFHDCPFSLA